MYGIDNKQQNFMLPIDGIDIKKIVEVFYHYRWVILITACVGAIFGFLYSFSIIPQYQTTALLQLKSQDNHQTALDRIGFNSSGNSDLSTLQALIRTRYTLEPVITASELNISTSPHYFPYFGQWVANHYDGESVAKPMLGLKSYAWGGEQIQIKEMTLPYNKENGSFRLIAGKESNYQLLSSDGQLILNGKVGKKETSTNFPGLSIRLSTLKARPGTEFTISHRSSLSLVSKLAHKIQISDVYGNDNSQNTGIFQITLTDTEPDRAVQTLDTLIRYIVINNANENGKENQKRLEFLTQRLPVLKNSLVQSEDLLNQFHIQNNTFSMAATQAHIIQQLNIFEDELIKLKSEKETLLQMYTSLHPLVIANVNKEIELQKQLAEIKKQIRKFPITNEQEKNLLREARIKETLYLSLLNNKEQLEISNAVTSSNIIIISDAVPPVCIVTSKMVTTLIGFLIGGFLTSIGVLIKSALIKTIEDSEQIEQKFNVVVRAVLPYSRKQKELEKAHKKTLETFGSGLSGPLILAKQDPDDLTIESLRSLRINLNFMKTNVGHQILAFMGSLSEIGKSFVSLNFAQVMADSGKRTLLIDADVRKGRLHSVLQQPKSTGLSEYLEGKCDYTDIVRSIDDNLFFISCGHYTDHPLKLFQSQHFQDLIKKVNQDFEQVIIDTAPILPVSDSILIAKQCHTKLFVVSAAKDTMHEVKNALNKASAHGIEIDGVVFNHSKFLMSHGSAHYRYAYSTTNAV